MSAFWLVMVLIVWPVLSVLLSLLIAGAVARREVQRITRVSAEDTTGGEQR